MGWRVGTRPRWQQGSAGLWGHREDGQIPSPAHQENAEEMATFVAAQK
jgi:hypothetical protein